ncbi:hypothetical protein SABVI_1308 [Streptococcus anginosus]|uniref:Phage protein n=1 Tax=Streptococcus anginosus TaxID=1328 RepID=A0ABT3E9B1_STRAP|nr:MULTISPECIES: hypothetical protein [Streptococcus]HEN0334347.1 hypothetical protein [Streptococcus agalactiae]KAA9247459.1 hypothetical protein F6I32_08655 [Streptococcus anginosus]KAA9253113.1 hypothetical protein F6I28_09045 [Streptococcus anginosus]KAA9309313.1 hypothetical protein F6H99_07785 [Streptococcus anginosus]KAA9312831.1 hypothetical protein F6H96_09355 [Streptococcus anginosus]
MLVLIIVLVAGLAVIASIVNKGKNADGLTEEQEFRMSKDPEYRAFMEKRIAERREIANADKKRSNNFWVSFMALAIAFAVIVLWVAR